MFRLKKACKRCPFRKNTNFLSGERAKEISKVIYEKDGYFLCHKTLNHDSELEQSIETPESQHCAGAMIVLEKMESPNQMMRISERLGDYKMDELIDDGIVDTLEEFRKQHAR